MIYLPVIKDFIENFVAGPVLVTLGHRPGFVDEMFIALCRPWVPIGDSERYEYQEWSSVRVAP